MLGTTVGARQPHTENATDPFWDQVVLLAKANETQAYDASGNNVWFSNALGYQPSPTAGQFGERALLFTAGKLLRFGQESAASAEVVRAALATRVWTIDFWATRSTNGDPDAAVFCLASGTTGQYTAGVFCAGNDGSDPYANRWYASGYYMEVETGTRLAAATTTAVDVADYIRICRDGNEMWLYRNGVREAQLTFTGAWLESPSDIAYNIGLAPWSGGQFLGTLQDFRITARVRSRGATHVVPTAAAPTTA